MNNREKIARTIAGLYNNAKPQGMGFLHFAPEKMDAGEACLLALRAESFGEVRFDYLKGRVMKIKILVDGTTGDHRLYDRDNGDGAAENAILDGLSDPYYNDFKWD